MLKQSVLFVCRRNTGRSQMAEAYLRHFLGDKVEVASAGTIPADQPNEVACLTRKGQPRERVREIRDLVKQKASDLLATLAPVG